MIQRRYVRHPKLDDCAAGTVTRRSIPVGQAHVVTTPSRRLQPARFFDGPRLFTMANTIAGLFVFLLVFAPLLAQAPTMVLKDPPASTSPTTDQSDDPTIVRRRSVLLTINTISEWERSPKDAELDLDPFDGVTLKLVKERTDAADGDHAATFGIVRAPAPGWFVLVRHGDIVAANVRVPHQGTYQIRYVAPGVHEVREIDESRFRPCGMIPADDLLPRQGAPPLPSIAGSCADDGSQIDLLVLYTEQARLFAGGAAAMQVLINLAEAETNSIYFLSQISTSVRVAAVHEVDYSESGNSQIDRERLMNSNDGFMDEIHALRDQHYADVVSLILHNLEVCGRASFAVQTGPTAFPQFGFNVVKDTCATGNYSFGHELGHNQGCRHNRAADNSPLGAFLYSHGHISEIGDFRTIMAVLTEGIPRIPYFSNPNLFYNGQPMGIPEGEPDSSDNARTITNTAFLVANFRNHDCDNDGVCDADELASGQAQDCNNNGRPDACEQDCNHNGRHDQCDINQGVSSDCSNNGIPDECEPDCNLNGVVDTCDILAGTVTDNNHNEIPDTCEPPLIYVDVNATGTNTGTSWINAARDLRAALQTAEASNGAVHEIWVAAGTYQPGLVGADRSSTFALVNGLRVYGGFIGGETSRTQRDPGAHPTVLSGDLNGDDAPGFINRSDNAYNVVNAESNDSTAILDGFIIIGGFADGAFPHNGGAGLFVSGGSPRIENCVFRDNHAGGSQIIGHGGALSVSGGTPVFNGCTFIANDASGTGGAVACNQGATPRFVSCAFLGNYAESGGAVRNGGVVGASPTFVNCVFSGNRALGKGGAIYNFGDAFPQMANCTMNNNNALLSAGGLFGEPGSTTALANCILWGNTDLSGDSQSAQFSGTATLFYNCIQNLVSLTSGNINSNPQFGNALGADSVAGTFDDQLSLRQGSPCVDSGSNGSIPVDVTDLDGDDNVTERLPWDVLRRARVFDEPNTPNTGQGSPPHVDRGAFENVNDCNGNGVTDSTEGSLGISADCNQNHRPDECESPTDCNANGVQDICDVPNGTSTDCNTNTILDECELANGQATDCNQNALPDMCDLASGTSHDCNTNAVPDECDFADGVSKDCDASGIPDECEDGSDCNHNGQQDICDIDANPRLDCNLNRLIDKCESLLDCNHNDELDICDLARGVAHDCDGNGIPDQCDIESGLYPDINKNKVPDPCEYPTVTADGAGCRYLSILPAESAVPVALLVRGALDDPPVDCMEGYVQIDGTIAAIPVFQTAAVWGTVYVGDSEIIPAADYRIYADYGSPNAPSLSLPVIARTWMWGDLNHFGSIDIDDLFCMLNAQNGQFNLCAWHQADLMGAVPNRDIDLDDMLAFLAAQAGASYPHPPPCP